MPSRFVAAAAERGGAAAGVGGAASGSAAAGIPFVRLRRGVHGGGAKRKLPLAVGGVPRAPPELVL